MTQLAEAVIIYVAGRLGQHLPLVMAARKFVKVAFLISLQIIQHLLRLAVVDRFFSGYRQRAKGFVMTGDPLYG